MRRQNQILGKHRTLRQALRFHILSHIERHIEPHIEGNIERHIERVIEPHIEGKGKLGSASLLQAPPRRAQRKLEARPGVQSSEPEVLSEYLLRYISSRNICLDIFVLGIFAQIFLFSEYLHRYIYSRHICLDI